MVVFRNISSSESDPVEQWGFEGILTAIDRGGLSQWRRIITAVQADPHGKVATEVDEAAQVAEDSGAAFIVARALRRARLTEKERFGEKFKALLDEAEMSQREAAEFLATSRPRVNSYCSGAVTPSAVVVDKLRKRIHARRRHLV